MARMEAVAKELKEFIRDAKNPDKLIGKLPVLSEFALVRTQGGQTDESRTRFVVRTLVPAYEKRLPDGPTGQAIRELLRWQDENGESRTLDVRYREVARLVHTSVENVARRKEAALLSDCARHFTDFDLQDEDGLAAQGDNAFSKNRELGSAPQIPGQEPTDVGIVSVYAHLDYFSLELEMRRAREINLLSTFIPAFDVFSDAIREALSQGAHVRILMVHPSSPAASMRTAGLGRDPSDVKHGVEHCLNQFARLASSLDEDDARKRLVVRLYNSLPSVAVYNVDDHSLVSVFLHGQLAIHAPQLELHGRESLLGKVFYKEFMTLWDRAGEVRDIRSWPSEIDDLIGET